MTDKQDRLKQDQLKQNRIKQGQIKQDQIKQELREALEKEVFLEDEEVLQVLDRILLDGVNRKIPLLEKERIRKELFYSVRKLDVLQELLDDPEITEIMVNGPDVIFYEKEGHIYPWDKHFSSQEKLMDVILQIVGKCNRVVNESMPIVDARLSNGDRVNVVIAPAALNGPILTIRRFPSKPIDMAQLIQRGTLSVEVAEYLERLVKEKCTMVIGGGTSTGKTTFLNALSAYIPREERIITIEETAELQLQNVPNLVRMESKQANMEGSTEITIQDLIRSALRMRPDRIIVGEIRGAEAVEMLFSAVNTGHRGSLCTAHANSCYDMISRLETMVLMGLEIPMNAIERQIASGIDILIHLTRMETGERKVTEITEVSGYKNGCVQLNPLFLWQEDEGLVQVNERKGQKWYEN